MQICHIHNHRNNSAHVKQISIAREERTTPYYVPGPQELRTLVLAKPTAGLLIAEFLRRLHRRCITVEVRTRLNALKSQTN